MKIKKTVLSACAVAAVLAGTAACTSDGEGPGVKASAAPTAAADTTCKNGAYSWFNVDKRDVLTGVAEKEKVSRKGTRLTHKLATLHTPRTAVTFEQGSRAGNAKAVLRSLAVLIGEADPDDHGVSTEFTNVRRAAPDINNGSTTIDGVGTIVHYAWVEQVTADFRYTCGGGKPVTGRATGWVIDGSGILECSTPIKDAKEGEPALTAARLSCAPDAPAAKP
ncbi:MULTISPECIES: hypothetical protein [unclassified Streptomyces]|uniref:hypothetical protein n=1 Tax=unclassified Streptomyces TaxID=2593676 RepID=UPI00165663A2|nr:hypothetical protein [Streptomyces sp. CB02980]MCB8901207.1 hypothetical protein [Streptomyces sp. CB02980]